MKKFFLEDLQNIINGNILNWNTNRPVELFVEQPDKPLLNCLYYLFDGCDDEDKLLKKLVECGATGVIIKAPHRLNIYKWKKFKIGVIEVEHLTESYLELAKVFRSQFNIPIIQVIGSSGKTTTKDMIGAVLNAGIPTLVGYNNYNAPSGVAYNLFSIRKYHRAAVLEVGMKGRGIMSLSSEMVKPNIGVLTSIQRAHLVSLGSIENIIEAKAEIFDYLDEAGLLIINGEDENCINFPIGRYKGKVLKYGFSDKFDLWASNIKYKNFKSYFRANGPGIEIDCILNTVGKYNIANALAAILVGLQLGLRKEDIKRGLSNFEPSSGRLKIYDGIKGTVLINDNFNANPDSTRQLLQEIPYFTDDKPLMLVLGDMERPDEEVRQYAKEVHFSIGEQLAQIKFDSLIAIGKWAKEYVRGAMSKGVPQSKMVYFETVEKAEKYFKSSIIPGSVIVFKASVYVPIRHLIRSLGVEY
ncbi:UDP-N-acetylmuramoyl-tripeptide--D-alanyl-D-alanine ligase [Clostridium polyendosporum]|uniref:UDP-N-acetylmuramoyl-tripeptide--D-alanyl-D-alanine ligase n=1 Tax=Clostridium polyendosporum TaxID=69208 RepID=A0A919RYW9_9CLOT|nr:UDP-N-acetylmuramoyl-tripeptide--D-alanyl-D-alanine ligase [Clostridium polyendosporum]GIM28015.1 UDP-N-acetylmuramoyl-tripeptide--D-alanyl-D-alanine ligase [Clostridium polyendosporum]